ncbi:unnamed protein product [Symbiodinium natans]|uniref:FIST C-domain domain-containing protein n=1 Tax=Symbiodinium natans TaxID=878477 RepID=A0A812QC09_9DINO|nr:unnamed protein product [Symbiodinium natans]
MESSRHSPARKLSQGTCLSQGFALADTSRDVLLTSLGLLSAYDLAQVTKCSRLFMLLSLDASRRPSLVAAMGSPEEVARSLRQRLMARPSLGFLFGPGDPKDARVAKLLDGLPPECQVVGAATGLAQALVAPGNNTEETVMRDQEISRELELSLMLGAFPAAVSHAFYVPPKICQATAQLEGPELAELLAECGVPEGPEWGTIVIILGGRYQLRNFDPERFVALLQQRCPKAGIIGGIVTDPLLLRRCGRLQEHRSGAVGLALRGDVPLTAMVSRGCKAIFRGLHTGQEAEMEPGDEEDPTEPENYLVVPTLVDSVGARHEPLGLAIEAQQKHGGLPLYAGLRPRGQEQGFLLEQLGQASFSAGGKMRLPFDATLQAQCGANPDCEVGLFQLNPDTCLEDLRRHLGHVRKNCEERQEEILGAVMFTCCGRRSQFFDEDFQDLSHFKAAFPRKPLLGIWANGEIGPQALAEAAPEEATRTGRAALQGFTAVFGIFRAPLPSVRRAAALPDDALPLEVGRWLSGRGEEARKQGDIFLQEGDITAAAWNYARAKALADVPSAEVPKSDRCLLRCQLSAVELKAGRFDKALALAEEALSMEETSEEARCRRSEALLSMGRAEEVVRDLTASSSTAPRLAALLEQAEQQVQAARA